MLPPHAVKARPCGGYAGIPIFRPQAGCKTALAALVMLLGHDRPDGLPSAHCAFWNFLSAVMAVRRRGYSEISRLLTLLAVSWWASFEISQRVRSRRRVCRGVQVNYLPPILPLGLRAPKLSSNVTVQRYHFRPGLQVIEIVSPLLHHFPSFRKMRGPVVGAPIRIAHRMGKLVFDVVRADP